MKRTEHGVISVHSVFNINYGFTKVLLSFTIICYICCPLGTLESKVARCVYVKSNTKPLAAVSHFILKDLSKKWKQIYQNIYFEISMYQIKGRNLWDLVGSKINDSVKIC